MKLQLLSDLHLETETFEPEPAADAEVLVLAGDIDSSWAGYRRFAGWPVPVWVVLGNHEFDGRDLDAALYGLQDLCAALGFTLLERRSLVHEMHNAGTGARIRLRVLGTTRWSDYNTFGPSGRARAERAAAYYLRQMGSQRGGQPLDVVAMRELGLGDRHWLETELSRPAAGAWDQTLVITHFGPSLRSADPRYGLQPGTASFCNADDDLIPRADLWLHGHLHCRHDYAVDRPGRRPTRVVCNARGLAKKGEHQASPGRPAHQPQRVLEL